MAIPDSLEFSLQDVVDEVNPSIDTLQTCFEEAVEENFDSRYKGDKDRLSNFRNYNGYGVYVSGLDQTTFYRGTSCYRVNKTSFNYCTGEEYPLSKLENITLRIINFNDCSIRQDLGAINHTIYKTIYPTFLESIHNNDFDTTLSAGNYRMEILGSSYISFDNIGCSGGIFNIVISEYIDLVPENTTISKFGGSGSINIYTGDSWEAVELTENIIITSATSGSGNGSINYFVDSNGSSSSRDLEIEVSLTGGSGLSKICTITQDAGPV